MGEFILKKTEAGYVFHLRANNRQTICTSQSYTSMVSCRHGVGSCRKNCASHIEDQTLQNPEKLKHPKYELYLDNAEQFRFRLKAPNGRIVAVSQGYTTKDSAKNGIESIRNNAPDAALFYDIPEEDYDELVTESEIYVANAEDANEDLSIFDEPECAPAAVTEQKAEPAPAEVVEEVIVEETVIETVKDDVVEEAVVEEVTVVEEVVVEEPAEAEDVVSVEEPKEPESASPSSDAEPKPKKKKGMKRVTIFQRFRRRR